MTLIYKEFTITGTVKEIKEFIELMENKNNTVNSNIDTFRFEDYSGIDRRIFREVYLNKNIKTIIVNS